MVNVNPVENPPLDLRDVLIPFSQITLFIANPPKVMIMAFCLLTNKIVQTYFQIDWQ